MRNFAKSNSLLLGCLFFATFLVSPIPASDLEDVKTFFREGDYEACAELAGAQVKAGVWNELWPRMLVESLLVTGNHPEALEALEKGLSKYPDSVRLRLLGVRVYQMNDQPSKADAQLAYIDELLDRAPWKLNNRSDLVPLGEFLLMRGEDPKEVLKLTFDQAIKFDPTAVEPYVATARLALDKNDDKLASETLAKVLRLEKNDPEIYFMLACAWSSTGPEKSAEYLQRSLTLNPKYIPSLVLMAESRISAEDYERSKEILTQIERINSKLPKLWALRAAIAHLQGEYASEAEFRKKALEPWGLNPEVDYLIGKQLAMHYRFAESVVYQRRALTMSPNYVPAKAQLAQDMLRLGQLDEGWKLVEEVRSKDPYNATVFNLKQLRSQLDKFATIEIPGFVIRMDAREAKIYGSDVVSLLSEARNTLPEKYAVKLDEPIFVEIFPRQKEFAIRTFGMPGGEGFLGVCFGRLITANSPAALKVDINWKAVLWHEYCHVVTLQKTKNKMPRWLSEGISVYEERQRNPSWGQSMNQTYREMLLGDDFVPMSRLSSAFLHPESPMHLQFAYYESSLAVEFWIQKYGMKSLLMLLDDLAVGMPADEALRRVPGSLESLDQEFHVFASELAQDFGKGVDMGRPSQVDKEDTKAWIEEHPDSLFVKKARCRSLITQKKWNEALPIAQELQRLLQQDGDNDGIYAMLASIHVGLGDVESERAAWVELANRSADCRRALMRLIEIDTERKDLPSVSRWCERMLEIDPLRFDVQQALANANEQLGAPEKVVAALTACLEMDPPDLARTHYRLAVAHVQLNQMELARRHVLMAIEESPRYLEALKLFSKIHNANKTNGESE